MLGEKTAEEVAAAAEVYSWDQDFQSFMSKLDSHMIVMIPFHYTRGIDRRNWAYESFEISVGQWLRGNNKLA
jgi:hypothetical protein